MARVILHLGVVQLLHGGVGDFLRLVLDEAVAPVQAAAWVLQHCARIHLQAASNDPLAVVTTGCRADGKACTEKGSPRRLGRQTRVAAHL